MTQIQASSADRPPVSRLVPSLLSARWWHKWINVFMGAVLAVWVVSGVVMLVPGSETSRSGQGSGRPIDWSDAATGRIVTIDATLAAAIAGDAVPNAPVAHVERVERPAGGFPGPFPAFHVVFRDDAGTEAWVAVPTGEVRRSERRDRVKSYLGNKAHLFAPLRELPGGDTTRKGVLTLASAVAMISIVTGYWLALPGRWRRRQVDVDARTRPSRG